MQISNSAVENSSNSKQGIFDIVFHYKLGGLT